MMKSNIDLTENEMFSRPARNFSFPYHRMFGYRFPWDLRFTEVHSDSELYSGQYEVIFTGDKEERGLKELCRQENTGNYCDCCGASLIEIPWDRTYGLCRRCHADMEKSYGNKPKFPWGEVSEMRGQRGNNPLSW